MELQVKKTNWYDREETTGNYSVESFLYTQLLVEEDVRLEQQPRIVCLALGRLVEKLMEKGILNLEDLHKIVGTYYNPENITVVINENSTDAKDQANLQN